MRKESEMYNFSLIVWIICAELMFITVILSDIFRGHGKIIIQINNILGIIGVIALILMYYDSGDPRGLSLLLLFMLVVSAFNIYYKMFIVALCVLIIICSLFLEMV